MRSAGLAGLGIVLVAVGIVGFVWTTSARSPAPAGDAGYRPDRRAAPEPAPRATLGAAIYIDGIGADGEPIPRSAVGPGMMGGGCVTCHGIDGRGGYFPMMGGFEAPDIRYSTLIAPHENGTEPGWSDEDISRAVTEGVEPDGAELEPFMPRWDLTASEFEALLGYLKGLD